MIKLPKILKICIKVSVYAVLLFIGVAFIINYYVKKCSEDRIITKDEASALDNVDCIVVLGAAVKDGNRPSSMLSDRLQTGTELFKSGAAPKIIMSGDHGRKEYDEVNVMKQYAVDNDVPSEDVFMDHAGFSTYESIYRAKEIFKAEKIIIVSQKYHLYRAVFIAEKLGLDAYGVAADVMEYRGQRYRDLREIAARNKDFFSVIFKPESTYMGDAVPVSGNGNVTNDK